MLDLDRKFFFRLIQCLVCLLLVSCAEVGKQDSTASAFQGREWPSSAENGRIEFIQAFSTPKDLGISPGFWKRLAGLFVGEDPVRLVRPTDVLVTSKEVLLVADPGAKAVHRFDIANKSYSRIRLEKDAAFRSPVALTKDHLDRIYISDSALNQVFRVEAGADLAVPLRLARPLSQPTGLSYDRVKTQLYVVNTRGHEVMVFDQEGKLLRSIGHRGGSKGEFNYPTQIWREPTTGAFWVTDSLNFRVQKFDSDGRFVTALFSVGDATGDLPRPKGVATDSDGNIYVMDALLNNMQIFNQQGQLLLYLGEQGRAIGQFWLPVGIYIDDDNRIYVADSFNSRIQIFRYKGNKG